MTNEMRKLMEAVELSEAGGGELPMIELVQQIAVVDDYGDRITFDLSDIDTAITHFAESYAEYKMPAGSAYQDTAGQWDQYYEEGRKIAKISLKKKK